MRWEEKAHLQTALERAFVPATVKSNSPANRPNIVSEIIGIIGIIRIIGIIGIIGIIRIIVSSSCSHNLSLSHIQEYSDSYFPLNPISIVNALSTLGSSQSTWPMALSYNGPIMTTLQAVFSVQNFDSLMSLSDHISNNSYLCRYVNLEAQRKTFQHKWLQPSIYYIILYYNSQKSTSWSCYARFKESNRKHNQYDFVPRKFVSQIYAVLSRGLFCRKFTHFWTKKCECNKNDKYEVCWQW